MEKEMQKKVKISSIEGEMIKYAKLGLPVIPCKFKEKVPLIKDWQKRRVTLVEEIKRWYSDYTNMNIGLPLGTASGIIAVDVDGKQAFIRLKELSNGDLPTTWSFQTPGDGKRYLYKIPEGVILKKYVEKIEGDHCELAFLAEGQQTIMPPSIHPNGNRYAWYVGKKPEDIEIAEAPKWMLDLMTDKVPKNTKKEKETSNESSNNSNSVEPSDVFERLSKRCPNFSKAIEVQRDNGLSEDEWFNWIKLLISAEHGNAAMGFSQISSKHDDRSIERIEALVAKMPKGGSMIRCTTFGCDECDIENCFNKVNENEEGNPTNSPGSFVQNMKSILPPKNAIYKPYLLALENTPEYDIDEYGNLCSFDRKGNPYIISNFVAMPELEIIRDDGVSEERTFRIIGLQYGQLLSSVDVSASDFPAMNWIIKAWGIGAAIRAGIGKKDSVRDAIQNMGIDTKKLRIYTHLGWLKLSNKRWVYLHANGCIGSDDVTIEVERGLQRYMLPRYIKDLKRAAKASKALLEIAPYYVTIPLLALCYLAPLHDAFKRARCEPNFLLWLYGGTGTRKTTAALLFLCHFGLFNGKNPPASFKDTANAIEKKAFATKDTVLLIDDYHPESSSNEASKMAQTAQRILRMFGDRIGRGRLTSKIEFQKEFPPRGECIVTGEDIPQGHSSVARFLGVEILKDDINLEKLTEAQNNSDLLGEAMRGYIEWLTPQMEELPSILSEKFTKKREQFQQFSEHGRIGEAAAWITISFEMMIEFFKYADICTDIESKTLLNESQEVLTNLIQKQNSLVIEEKPVELFVKILKEQLVSGKVRVDSLKNIITQDTIFQSGECIGWFDENYYYLRPEITYNIVNRFLYSRGQQFPITERTLWKQLDEAGLIQTEKGGDGKVQRCPKKAVPKKAVPRESERLRLLHLKREAIDQEEK